jgi:hypothetical protein
MSTLQGPELQLGLSGQKKHELPQDASSLCSTSKNPWLLLDVSTLKVQNDSRFLSPNFQTSGTLGIDSTESIPCDNQFRRGIDSREGGKEDQL